MFAVNLSQMCPTDVLLLLFCGTDWGPASPSASLRPGCSCIWTAYRTASPCASARDGQSKNIWARRCREAVCVLTTQNPFTVRHNLTRHIALRAAASRSYDLSVTFLTWATLLPSRQENQKRRGGRVQSEDQQQIKHLTVISWRKKRDLLDGVFQRIQHTNLQCKCSC